MSAKRVMIFNHTSRLGGAERVLLTFLSGIDNTALDVLLVAPAGELIDRAKQIGIPYRELLTKELRSSRRSLSAKDAGNTIQIYRDLIITAKDYGPHLLMSNSIKAHVIGTFVSKRLRIPQFVRLHDQLSSFSFVGRTLLRVSLRTAAFVSCVSNSVANEVISLIGTRDKVDVCYNGVKLSGDVGSRAYDYNYVVVAGWILPWKGFDVFIRAMELVASSKPDWHFIIAGDVAQDVVESSSYREKLRGMIWESKWRDRFHMTGPYQSLSEVLGKASNTIFVLPSQRPDPLPTVILEAAIIGVPVIASDMGGAREMISHGENGMLTQTTPRAIAQSVLSLMDSPEMRLKYSEKLKDSIVDRFSVNKYVNQLSKQLISNT